jgi:hypothetical protein
MKKLLINSVLCMFAFSANAQLLMDALDPTASGTLFRNDVMNKKDLAEIKGSAYLVDEFRLADVAGIKQQIMVRYNALTDMIEVETPKKEVFSLMKKEPFNTITIIPFTDKIKLLNYKTKETEIYGYLVELFNSNKIALYRRDRVILQKGKEALNTYSPAVPARYVKANEEFFISKNGEMAFPAPRNKKELLETFPEKKTEITDFIKKNDYSHKDEKSIINIMRYISGF